MGRESLPHPNGILIIRPSSFPRECRRSATLTQSVQCLPRISSVAFKCHCSAVKARCDDFASSGLQTINFLCLCVIISLRLTHRGTKPQSFSVDKNGTSAALNGGVGLCESKAIEGVIGRATDPPKIYLTVHIPKCYSSNTCSYYRSIRFFRNRFEEQKQNGKG